MRTSVFFVFAEENVLPGYRTVPTNFCIAGRTIRNRKKYLTGYLGPA
jgi:hypothetical protein